MTSIEIQKEFSSMGRQRNREGTGGPSPTIHLSGRISPRQIDGG